jgi:outer membrane protein insertion porin family
MHVLTAARRQGLRIAAGVALALVLLPGTAAAQATPPCPAPRTLPPPGSVPQVRCIQIVAHPVNETIIPAQTYNVYIKGPRTYDPQPPAPADTPTVFASYDESAVQADFWSLWRTGFLDNLWVEVIDEPFANGVMGKHVVFHIEERSKVKDVRYLPTDPEEDKTKIAVSDIEEALSTRGITVRLDSFVDDAIIRRVIGVIKELHVEKGYLYTTVDPELTPLPAGPKLVSLAFHIDHGPKVKIREITFEGNEAIGDGKLRGQMKENKEKGWLSWITSGGTYYESKFPADAEAVRAHYNNKGYARAIIGNPEIEELETTPDGGTRWIRLRIPVEEGPQYTIGTFQVAGDEVVPHELLRQLYAIEAGDVFSRKALDKGYEKAEEAFGSLGYPSWQPDFEFNYHDFNAQTLQPIPGEPPILDITLRSVPGSQQHINRITFLGNTTTHDRVIRRELRVAEGGVFNTVALKDSVRRLNQLGYFRPLEDSNALQVTPAGDDKVDLSIRFEEQNRNQLTFGAGVSQFDGFFGQLGFQTANFLGRGETLGVSLQKGSQAENYQVSFSEPYLLDRPISMGFDVFSREFRFPFQYTQGSTGTNFVVGYPLADYTRGFVGYSFEEVTVKDIDPLYLLPEVLDASPFLRDSLLIDTGGRRSVSKVSPSVVFNTVNHPIFPSLGTRLTGAFDLAGLGGNTSYVQSRLEAVQFVPFSPRLGIGGRIESRYIRPYGDTENLPIFERLFLGGEYSVRGFDIRSIGPRDDSGRIVLGGNKTLLFNGEFYFNVASTVRILAFYDAGQVRDLGQPIAWWEDVREIVPPPGPLLAGAGTGVALEDPDNPSPPTTTRVIGRRNAFKTSTGLELRFFMPILNVPFRLIAAYNPQRGGILNNSLMRQPRFTFRFAVGTTF